MDDPHFGKKILAMLATGRVANLPTVWSNVILSFFLAVSLPASYSQNEVLLKGDFHYHYWLALFACISASCLYVGGCMLGDYRDLHFDRKHRPGRPLVTGLLSPSLVAMSAWFLLSLGIIIGTCASGVALIIALNIPLDVLKSTRFSDYHNMLEVSQLTILTLLTTAVITYAFFHKRSRPIALVNMGLCRTLLILFASSLAFPVYLDAFSSPYYASLRWVCGALLIISGAVGLYTLLLASVAATESNQNKVQFTRILKACMFLLPILAIGGILIKSPDTLLLTSDTDIAQTLRGYFTASLLIYFGWMIYTFRSLPKDKPGFVSKALAGFCLLDACFAATYSVTVTIICLGLFALSLILQRITPAT